MRCCSASSGLRRRRCWSSISPTALRADDPAFQAAIDRSLARVRTLPSVTGIILPSADPSLISDDGDTAYAIAGLSAEPEEAQRLVPEFEAALVPQDEVRISVTGAGASYRDIETASQRDLRRAEVIVFPIALVALLLVFGSVVAALMPLAIGAAGVALVLVSIFVATRVTDLSIFVLNLATMLGLGLSVDYSLFVTSRYREELARNGGNVPLAVERTVATAGKAVFFSGATVLIGLMGLALFEFMFLRSVGIAGVIVVAWSTVAALTLLPALLSVVGTRIDRFAIRRPRDDTSQERVLGAPLTRRDGATGGGADPDAGAALAARVPLSAGEHLVARRDDPAARSPLATGVRHSGRGVRRRGDLPVPDRSAVRIARRHLHHASVSARSTTLARGWPMTPA